MLMPDDNDKLSARERAVGDVAAAARRRDDASSPCGGDSSPSPSLERSPNSIWVDVTTMLRWDRPIVGVVRVEEQLVRWVLDHTGDLVRFCRYDQTLRTFLDVSRQQVAAKIRFFEQLEGRIAVSPQIEFEVPVASNGKASKGTRKGLAKVLRRLKKRLRRTSESLAGSLFRSMIPRRVSRDVRRKVSEQGRPVAQPPCCKFNSGDAYISVGSDWDDKDLRRLYEFKQLFRLRVVGICYDTIPIKFPHLTVEGTDRKFPRHLADLAWVADHVLCISNCTQRDFLEFAASVGAPWPTTSVLRLGNDLSRREKAATQNALRDDRVKPLEGVARTGVVIEIARSPFILFVSTIERRKNHDLLYKVWVRLIEAGCKMPDLVFVGMRGWGIDDLLADLSRDRRVKGRIHVLHGISDAELAFLYERCEYTVYPSLYEGWGLPVVESFAFGKFCLCSNAGSLTEAGENLAEYLDPWDVNAWTDRIRYFSEHPEEVEMRHRKVAASFQPHSWQETSASILRKAEELAWPSNLAPSN